MSSPWKTSRHGEADRAGHAWAEHDVHPGGGREAAQGHAHVHVVQLEGHGDGGQGAGGGLRAFFGVAHDHAGIGPQIGGGGGIALRILREPFPVIHEGVLLLVVLGRTARQQQGAREHQKER